MNLNWFSPEEFREWWSYMDPELLRRLDQYREELGVRVSISPAKGSLGRHLGNQRRSFHNIDYHGSVKAADIMPWWERRVTFAKAVEVAHNVGFRGIGIYPLWKPRPGLHLDLRTNPTYWWTDEDPEGNQRYNYVEFTELLNTLRKHK